MEKNEELEEAQRRYPIGTKFKSPKTGDVYTITRDNYYTQGDDIRCQVDKEYSPWLRYNGNWAEIISKPEPVINNNYQIY